MKNKQGGFLQLIIIVIIAFLLMRHFNVTISDVVTWFKELFNSIK